MEMHGKGELMSELIDRQAAISEIVGMTTMGIEELIIDVDKEEYDWIKGLSDSLVKIINLPSAQPRKGEWIDYSDEGYVECPFCHSATNCEDNKDELHYCFSCGAELS